MLLQIAEVVLVLMTLSLVGLGPAFWLLHDDERPYQLIWSPILGLAILALFCLNASLLGFPGTKLVWPLIAISASLVGAGAWKRTLEWKAIDVRYAYGIAAISGLLLAWPGLLVSGDVYMAYANPDAFNYQMDAEYLRDHSLRDPIQPDGYRPGELHVYTTVIVPERIGADTVLAWFSVLTGRTSKEAYFFVLTALSMLAPLGAFLFIRCGLNLTSGAARLGALLVGCSALTSLVYYQQLLGQITAAALAAALLSAVFLLLRRPCLSNAVLTALLLAGLVAVYPEMLYLLGPVFVAVAGTEMATGRLWLSWRLSGMLILALLAAFALNPYYSYHAATFLMKQAGGSGGGSTYAFFATPLAWPVAAGLVPYLSGGATYLSVPNVVWVACGITAVLVFGIALVRSLLIPGLRPAGIGSIVILLLSVVLLWGKGYTYGAFKTVLFGNFLLLALLAASAQHADGHWPVVRRHLPKVLIVILAGNLSASLWYGAYSIVSWGPWAILYEDTSFRDLEAAVTVRPPNERILVDVQQPARQLWAVYALRNRLTGVRNAHNYLAVWSQHWKQPIEHGFEEELVLTDAPRHDITAANSCMAIWKSPRFQLRQLRDYVVIGEGWHALEQPGENAYRWLEKEGEVMVVRPSGPFRLSFHVAAGPGLRSSRRTIEVYAQEKLLLRTPFENSAEIVSPPVFARLPAATLRIRVVEDAARIPSDPRVMNVRVSNIAVVPEQEFVLRTVATVGKGMYADGWVAPSAVTQVPRVAGASHLRVTGVIPNFANYAFPLEIKVKCDGKPSVPIRIGGPGVFEAELPSTCEARSAGMSGVAFESQFSFQPKEILKIPDDRQLSFRDLQVLLF